MLQHYSYFLREDVLALAWLCCAVLSAAAPGMWALKQQYVHFQLLNIRNTATGKMGSWQFPQGAMFSAFNARLVGFSIFC